MEAKSHDSDELVTVLVNSVEKLSQKMDKLEEQYRKSHDVQVKMVEATEDLNGTIKLSNKIFEQVATGVKSLYEKVVQMEVLSKMLGGLGGLGPLFGGQGPKKP